MQALPSKRRGEESHTRRWFLEDLDKCRVARADKGLWEFQAGGNYFQSLLEEGAFELALTNRSKEREWHLRWMASYGKGKEDKEPVCGEGGVLSHSFGQDHRLKGSQGNESWSSKGIIIKIANINFPG